MRPENNPFASREVARSKQRKLVIRAFVLPIALGVLIGMTEKLPTAGVIRLGLCMVPFGPLVIAMRWFQLHVRLRLFALNVLMHSAIFLLFFAVDIFMIAVGQRGLSEIYNFAFIRHPWTLALMLGWFYLAIFLVTSFKAVSRKLGPGTLWNWFRGYYYTPKEEERIFMFLDLRNSTTIAERLGNLEFSALVRDFFQDLTDPVLETRGEVSHYIGDEAVLTWRTKAGLTNARCIECFYRMQLAIDKRSMYYLQTYGFVPEFKAGAHIGRVVATEVGSIKSEIVFHGDVLNTAARVQGQCNEVGEDFLITSALADRLPPVPWMELRPIGDLMLKGKEEAVGVVAVHCPQLALAESPNQARTIA